MELSKKCKYNVGMISMIQKLLEMRTPNTNDIQTINNEIIEQIIKDGFE